MNEYPILLVDDEYSNIEPTIKYLDICGIATMYCPTIAEAANEIFEGINAFTSSKDISRLFGAVVLDNHFQDHELSTYDHNFNGIDFAVALAGATDHFEKYHERFITDFFPMNYQKVIDHYKNRIILFSGSAVLDSRHRPDLFNNFIVVGKKPDSEIRISETSLVGALESLGYEFCRPESEIEGIKDDCELEDNYDCTDYERSISSRRRYE